MRKLILIAGLVLAACSPAPDTAEPANDLAADNAMPAPGPAPAPTETPTPAPSNALSATGWGPLRIGMTKAEITQALGADSNPGAVGGPDPEACDVYRPTRAPEGMLVMLEQGKLTRISLTGGSALRSDAGIGVGDTADAVRKAYGDRIVAEPHKYVEAAEYLTAWNGTKPTKSYVEDPNTRGIRYETDANGKVTAIRAGGPSIQYVEGCL